MTADDPPLWQTLGPAAPFDSHSILELIPPSSVRLVPLPIVALILLGFVVLIGPGDYLLLGLVRRRKLTWVLFPVLTLGLTGGMMALSNHFMGSGAQVRAVVWLDLGEDGRPVRESRAEMHFTGRSGELELVGDDRLLTTWSDDSVGNPWSSRPALLMEEAGEAGIRYAGQMPGHYTLRRRVEQWSPIFARSLSLQAQAPPLTLHWEAIDPAVLDNEEATRRAVLRLVEAAGRPVQVHLYHGNTRWSLTPQRSPEAGPPTPTAWRRETLRREIHEMEYWDYQDYGDDVYNDPMSPWLWNTYLLDITTALPASGLFTLLGRLAPTDGPGGEDLVLLDPTDPTQWVVVVEFEYEGNHYYCRRVYHTPTEQP